MGVVRIGVLSTWLSERYLPFWEPYLAELGQTIIHSTANDVAVPFPEPIRQTIGEVINLKQQNVDFLLIPDVQLGVESNKGSISPWLQSLEASLLRIVPGMPDAMVVPADLSESTRGIAAEIGQKLCNNPQLVRQALDQHKKHLLPVVKKPIQRGTELIGLVGLPFAQTPAMLAALETALEAKSLSLFKFDKTHAELRVEGSKFESDHVYPTDLEVLGQHRYLNRIGLVKGLIYLQDEQFFPFPKAVRKAVAKGGGHKPSVSANLDSDWEAVAQEISLALAAGK